MAYVNQGVSGVHIHLTVTFHIGEFVTMKIDQVQSAERSRNFSQLPAFKPLQPLSNRGSVVPIGKKDVFFGSTSATVEAAFKDAQKMADLGGLREGYVHRMMRGVVDLNEVSDAFETLSPEDTQWLDAYDQIMRYALREVDPKRRAPGSEDVLDPAKRHPKVNEVLADLGISSLDEFREPVLHSPALREKNTIPLPVYDRLVKLEAPIWKVPESVDGERIGGKGFKQPKYAAALERLAFISAILSASISATNTIGTGSLKYGTPAQQKRWFRELAQNDRLAAFATTEKNIGTDLNAIETRARIVKEGDQYFWEITGNKRFTTNALKAGLMIVTAQTDLNGVSPRELEQLGLRFADRQTVLNKPNKVGQTAFIVDLPFRIYDSDEQTREHLEKTLPARGIQMKQMNLSPIRGTWQVETQFDKLRLPVENVIGQVGGGKQLAINGLSNGRASVASLSIGAMERVIQMAMDRAHDPRRKMFGGWQSDLEHIKDRIGFFKTQLAGVKATSEMVNSMIAKRGGDTHLIPESSLVKVMATEAAHQVALEVRQMFGGDGFNLDIGFDLPQLVEDADIARVIEGVNPAMLQAGAGIGFAPFGLELNSLAEYGGKKLGQIVETLHLPEFIPGVKKARAMASIPTPLTFRMAVQTGKRLFTDRYFRKNQGVLEKEDADWLKESAKSLSWVMANAARIHQKNLINRQTFNMEMGRAIIDFMGVMASQVKLAKYASQLPPGEVEDLKDYVALTKRSFARRLDDLTKGLPDTRVRVQAGERAIRAYRQQHNLESPIDVRMRERAAAKAAKR